MIEWIVTSCILALIMIGIRFLFLGKISLRLQYALWGILLARLLIPVTFGSSAASAANLPAVMAQQPQVQAVVDVLQPTPMEYEEAYHHVVQQHTAQGVDVSHLPEPELEALRQEAMDLAEERKPAVTLTRILTGVWLTGMMAVGGIFLWTNLRFGRRLRRSREPLAVPGSQRSVYVAPWLDTPCLFGLWNPAVYLTEEALTDAALRRHSIAHETTHFRHGDHIWSLLRGLCLAIHWYNPLVWWAAFLSRRDGELACDEGTIRRLGEQERAEYGRTLIGMTCRKRVNVLNTATTMNAGKSGIKERILLMVRKPKNAVITLAVVALIAAAAVLCTFAGARSPEAENNPEPEILQKGQPVFPEGTITGITIHLADGREIPVGKSDLRKMTAWVRGFAYGDVLENAPETDSGTLTLTYADGSTVTGGIDATDVDGVRYQVLRRDFPDCWNRLLGLPTQTIPPAPTLPEGSQETWPDESATKPVEPGKVSTEYTLPTGPVNAPLAELDNPELGQLYDGADPDRLCIAVKPTGARSGNKVFYHPFYLIPENQETLLAAWKQAFENTGTGGEDENARYCGWYITFRGEMWFALSDGTFTDFYGRVRTYPYTTDELFRLCQQAVRAAGIGEPVRPEELTGIRKVTVQWNGTHVVTDRETLALIEEWMTDSVSMGVGGAGCPFVTLMTLELENGETRTVAMAADGCCAWMSQGVYYRYDSASGSDGNGNTKFYSLFAASAIRYAMHHAEDMNQLLSLIHYLDWGIYAEKYGRDETFALMEKLAAWVKADPQLDRCGGFIGWIQGLEGEYRTRYAGYLAEIYRLNPRDCAWAIMGNAGPDVRNAILEMLAELWNMDKNAVAETLKAQYAD